MKLNHLKTWRVQIWSCLWSCLLSCKSK